MKKSLLLLVIGLTFGAASYAGASSYFQAELPTFDIKLNGNLINNNDTEYPVLMYNDIAYFPMTYEYTHSLGIESSFSEGLLSLTNNSTDIITKKLYDANIVTRGEKRYFSYSEPYLVFESKIDFLTGNNTKAIDTLIRVASKTDASVIKVSFRNNPRNAPAEILFDTTDARDYAEDKITLAEMIDKINVNVNYFPVKNIKVSIDSNR
ncbi:hypothetical protein [Gorillibacterium sp. sgz5001074]|uniref:hypothetical protein n=1 Tax=Gorillibacterium sp. sgz5001074 TaxID=3446695 RepID=UPI003F679D8A